jgi:hypothetical protein
MEYNKMREVNTHDIEVTINDIELCLLMQQEDFVKPSFLRLDLGGFKRDSKEIQKEILGYTPDMVELEQEVLGMRNDMIRDAQIKKRIDTKWSTHQQYK